MARLDLADAWVIIGPVNWYGPTSNLKLMFDRQQKMGLNHDTGLHHPNRKARHSATERNYRRPRRARSSGVSTSNQGGPN